MKYLYSKYQLILLVFVILISSTIQPQWNIQYSQSGDLLNCVHFVDYNNGWAVGGRFGVGALILKTSDGGANWSDNLIIPGTVNLFNSVYFTDLNTGWAIANAIMMQTTNAGNSWDTSAIPTNGYLHQIQFVDSNYGWVAGTEDNLTRGVILRTTDGGSNWDRIEINNGGLFYSISFLNQDLGWGGAGEIYKTTDGGLNWIIINDSTGGGSICFADELNGWCGGASSGGPYGFINKTTDGGYNWSSTSGPDIPGLMDVSFFDKNIGWAVGYGSSSPIIKTTDGGENWFHQESSEINALNSVFIIDSSTGWSAGNGVILKTTNGGVTFINEEGIVNIPSTFKLNQNYPNPFNPRTKIEFSIRESGIVSLRVYDVLGNVVLALVDEYKPLGTYEVDWNATGLPSGVYLYQLKTDGYVESKKMILLK
jgi:photosystem II stability/assembly factor-like uncharacterized protein